MKHAIEGLLGQYEQGRINRRALVAGLAALATAGPARGGAFQSLGLNHIAVRVADVKRSRDFYQKHFGMPVLTESGSNCFLGIGKDHFLTLFQGQKGELDHYCISIDRFEPDAVMKELKRQGLRPNRPSGTNRIYFPDPDGITVQVSAVNHRP